MRVDERGKDMVTSSQGEFWRLLTPGGNYFAPCTISTTGVYTIWAHREERSSVRVEVEVEEGEEGPRVDLQLVGSHCHSYVQCTGQFDKALDFSFVG